MDQNTVLGLTIGLGCGVCIGWLCRRQYGRLTVVRSLSNSKNNTAEDVEFSDAAAGEYKMVLVVRTDLKMGKGKVAAQCAHAAVNCCSKLISSRPSVLHQWEMYGQPKVVLKTDTDTSLLSLAKEARKLDLTASVISDAGRTQIAPGTKTVLGLGPGPAELIDKVTGHLKLF